MILYRFLSTTSAVSRQFASPAAPAIVVPKGPVEMVFHPYAAEFVPKHETLTKFHIRGLQNFLDQMGKLMVLTGAGISTESGIPDYRSEETGRFARSKHKPMSHQEFLKSPTGRQRYWARSFVGWPRFSKFEANINHKVLADWERQGKLQWLVTQNVDRLHQKAGSANVTDLHGSLYVVRCLNCSYEMPRDEVQDLIRTSNPSWNAEACTVAPDGDVDLTDEQTASFKPPSCPKCSSGVLKPAVVFFGDNVPQQAVDFVMSQLKQSDALLILGSTCAAFSAFRIVLRAVDEGRPVAIVNIGFTRADDYADVIVNGRLSNVLPELPIRQVMSMTTNVSYKLVLKVAFEEAQPEFDLKLFDHLIHSAVQTILGESGLSKEFSVNDFDAKTLTGTVLVPADDLHLFWAAFSIYGSHLGCRVAIHLEKLFKVVSHCRTS